MVKCYFRRPKIDILSKCSFLFRGTASFPLNVCFYQYHPQDKCKSETGAKPGNFLSAGLQCSDGNTMTSFN